MSFHTNVTSVLFAFVGLGLQVLDNMRRVCHLNELKCKVKTHHSLLLFCPSHFTLSSSHEWLILTVLGKGVENYHSLCMSKGEKNVFLFSWVFFPLFLHFDYLILIIINVHRHYSHNTIWDVSKKIWWWCRYWDWHGEFGTNLYSAFPQQLFLGLMFYMTIVVLPLLFLTPFCPPFVWKMLGISLVLSITINKKLTYM